MQDHTVLQKKTMLRDQVPSDECDSCSDSNISSELLIFGHICCNGTATTVLYFFSTLIEVQDLGFYGLLTLQRRHHLGMVEIYNVADKMTGLCPSAELFRLNFLVFVRHHCPEPGSRDCLG